jgi:threonine/homoserine/homoserine lactone efflux protein
VLLAVAVGVAAVLLSLPHAGPILVAVSAVYMLYLAWRIATAPPLAMRDTHATAPGMFGGFLLAVANPKAFLAIAAVFAGTSVVRTSSGLDALVKVVVLAVMIVVIHLAWLAVGASLSRALSHARWSRVINIALSLALVGTAALALLGGRD